jgi:hypothetical protein
MISRKQLLAEMLSQDIPNKLKKGPAALLGVNGSKSETINFSRCGSLIIAKYGKLRLPIHFYYFKELK